MQAKSNTEKIAERIMTQIRAVTGYRALSVVSLEKAEDGWTGRVEVIELTRVPDTQDLVGVYEVTLDGTGDLTSWDRVSSRIKGQPIGSDFEAE